MTDIKQIIDTLTKHNEWRRGGEGPATNPKLLGEAIDGAIAELVTLSARDAEIARLQSRLEISPEHSYDGIDCRDVTIRELEAENLRLCDDVILLNAANSILEGQLRTMRAKVIESDAMRDLIAWLLGENGDFPRRANVNDGLYWWRKELRQRWSALAAPCDQQKEPT